jgi:hypothetical protein
MLQIGREPVFGEAQTDILVDASEALIREAMGEEDPRAAAAQPAPPKRGKRGAQRAARAISAARANRAAQQTGGAG